jgi:hypothetical protein
MDAKEKLLNLKQALDYLDATHGLRFTIVAIRKKRAQGTAPEFFIPAGMRDLRTTATRLDAWVAACAAHPEQRALAHYPDPEHARLCLQLAKLATDMAREPRAPMGVQVIYCDAPAGGRSFTGDELEQLAAQRGEPVA